MLLELLQKHVNIPFHKASSSRHVGPCPKCGGSPETERFSIRTGADKAFFHCYSCGWNGDLIKALRELEGMNCPEAHAAAGKECDRAAICPAGDKCSKGLGKRSRRGALETPAVPTVAAPGFIPAVAISPADLWRQKAEALVSWAHQNLLEDAEQLAYLAGRGLDLVAVKRARLGCIPADLYRERAAWGLPVEMKENGKAKKLWMPRGIVIPAIIGDQLHRVRIRRPNEDLDADRERNPGKEPLRYYAIPGSGNDVVVLGAGRPVVIPVESDFDAHLLHHLVGDFASVIPLTTCAAKPKETAALELSSAVIILVATDNDPAGDAAFKWWAETYPDQAKRWSVPEGKDPGEAYQRGVDLRAWVLSGVPISLHPKKKPELPGPDWPPAIDDEIATLLRNARQLSR
jgi:DNA primase